MATNNRIIEFTYIAFAFLGALLPTISNIEFIQQTGPSFNILLFIDMASSNPAAQSLSRDLLIGASAMMTWIIIESRRLDMRNIWIIIVRLSFKAMRECPEVFGMTD